MELKTDSSALMRQAQYLVSKNTVEQEGLKNGKEAIWKSFQHMTTGVNRENVSPEFMKNRNGFGIVFDASKNSQNNNAFKLDAVNHKVSQLPTRGNKRTNSFNPKGPAPGG